MVVQILQEHHLSERALRRVGKGGGGVQREGACQEWWGQSAGRHCSVIHTVTQAHTCPGAHLCICSILKGIEDLLEGDDLLCLAINGLPHNTVCLMIKCDQEAPKSQSALTQRWKLAFQVRNVHCRNDNNMKQKSVALTPFPSFCCISYFLRMCLR